MTHTSPKVSVLVTFYNQQDCVDRALESVFSQKCDFFFEVLIGDDGSSDKTWEKVLEWRQKYPEQIREFKWDRDPNKNYSSIVRASNNRAGLLEKARGEYLVFLDGDDYFLSNKKLQIQADILDSNPKISCCVHNMLYLNKEGKSIDVSVPENMPNRTLSMKQYWTSYGVQITGFMFRNIFRENFPQNFDRNNFDDNTIAMWMMRGNVYYLSNLMAAYTQDNSSLWHTTDEDLQNYINLNDFYYELAKRPDLKTASIARHTANLKWLRSCKLACLEKTLGKTFDELYKLYPYATKELLASGKPKNLESMILQGRITLKIHGLSNKLSNKRFWL